MIGLISTETALFEEQNLSSYHEEYLSCHNRIRGSVKMKLNFKAAHIGLVLAFEYESAGKLVTLIKQVNLF